MKKHILLILILLSNFLFASNIEETLEQIKALRKEIAQNEILLEKKIADLKKSNLLFADQDAFESNLEYIARMSKAIPQINQLRKQFLGDLDKKLSILSGSLFETKNITIDLDPKKYNSNTEKWDITVKHLEYGKEIKKITISISKKESKLLYKNWNIVKKTGILAIGAGDKIVLAKIIFKNPINGFKLEYIFNPSIIIPLANSVYSVNFSQDGNFLAVGSDNAEIFNISTKEKIFSVNCSGWIRGFGSDYAHSVNFSSDSKYLAIGRASKTEIYNISTKEKIFSKEYGASSVNFSPDGKYLAVGSRINTVIFNVSTKEKVFSKEYGAYSVNFSPDGKFLAVGSYRNTVIFNVSTQEKVFSKEYGANSVNFSPDGKYLAVGTSYYAEIFNVSTQEKVFSKKYNGVNSITFSKSGKYFAVGITEKEGTADSVEILKTSTKEKIKSIGFFMVGNISFSPDEKYIAIAGNKYVSLNLTLFQPEEETFKNKRLSSNINSIILKL